MITDYYLQTYLYDIIGMKPQEAIEYLQASPAARYFRSMRVVYDVPFDPEVHRSKTSWVSGVVTPVFKPEEREQGRVTVRLSQHGEIKDSMLEHGWRKLGPAEWPPPDRSKPYPGEVFVLGPPVFIGKMGTRRDIETIIRPPVEEPKPKGLVRRFKDFFWGRGETTVPQPVPSRGWFIQGIESLHIEDRGPGQTSEPAPPPPPQKPYVPLRFEEVPW